MGRGVRCIVRSVVRKANVLSNWVGGGVDVSKGAVFVRKRSKTMQ